MAYYKMSYLYLLLLLGIVACQDAGLPSEQVPVAITVNNQPSPPVPQPTPAEVPAPSEQVQQAPLPNAPASIAEQGGGGMMSMENLDNVKVTMDPSLLLSSELLVEKVQQSIIPVYKNWVLFKYGTYVILDDINNIPDVGQEALRLLEAYRPKSALEKPDWDYSISHLEQVEGWSVYGNGYGIYTYVHPDEMIEAPDPPNIIVFSRNKRTMDEANPQILYISSAEGIRAY